MGIQRKKQYPDLAYRTSEVIGTDRLQAKDSVDLRTRSEERNFGSASKSGPRSRSAEPSVGRQHQKKVMIQSYPPVASGQSALMPKMEELPTSLAEGVQKNTEYRSQFAWPRHSGGKICTARKSVSMGFIKAPDQPDVSILPKTKDSLGAYQKLATQEEEVEPAKEKPVHDSKKKVKTEYKAKYKPFTSYVYIDGQWKKTSRLVKIPEHHGSSTDSHPWYSEVMERLQRANEYKCRGHGFPLYGELLPGVYSKQHQAIPFVRSKKELPELHTPVVSSDTKSVEGRRKERKEKHEREKKTASSMEKKPEKEIKTSKRPKSADPTKGRKPRAQQRPQTAPPPVKERPSIPVPAHHAYARKSATKASQSETRAKSLARPPTSRKVKEDISRSGLPADGRASRTSYHPPASSGGKVWLQAGAPVQTAPSDKESFKGKHSDAVRPSTLLPPKPKSPPPIMDEEPAVSEQLEGKELPSTVIKATATPVSLTHVQTPEEVTGVKSPEPENWTVPLDKGKKLQWTESSTNEPLLSQVKIATPKPEVLEKESVGVEKLPEHTAVPAETGVTSVPIPETQKSGSSPSVKMTTADVLDRARSRLDQFWGKNK